MEQALEPIFSTPESPSQDAPTGVPCSFPLYIAFCVSLRTVFSTEGTNGVRFSALGLNKTLTLQSSSTHTKPIQVHDAATGQGAKIRVSLDADRSDNPMQSESACHVGASGNHNCRKCDNGGTATEKESDAGYHQLFFVRHCSFRTVIQCPLTVVAGWET